MHITCTSHQAVPCGPLHHGSQDEVVQKLRSKQSFEFRLGDLFRKNNVTAVLRSWDENGDGK